MSQPLGRRTFETRSRPTMELHGFLVKMSLLLVMVLGSLVAQNGPSGWTASPFSAPGLPLAVRSPYLNSWFPQTCTECLVA